MAEETTNFDLACARLGSKLAEQSDDKTLTDALSVLEEQGLYAFFLFLGQKSDRKAVTGACCAFLREQFSSIFDGNDEFSGTQKLAEDLDRLLFARDLLRQALIYGRYHAKAGSSRGTEP